MTKKIKNLISTSWDSDFLFSEGFSFSTNCNWMLKNLLVKWEGKNCQPKVKTTYNFGFLATVVRLVCVFFLNLNMIHLMSIGQWQCCWPGLHASRLQSQLKHFLGRWQSCNCPFTNYLWSAMPRWRSKLEPNFC